MASDFDIELDFGEPPARPAANPQPWPGWLVAALALVSFALLAALTVYWTVNRVETRLARTVAGNLQQAGVEIDNLTFSWRYRDVLIEGALPAGTSAALFTDFLRQAGEGGVRAVRVFARESEVSSLSAAGTVDVSAQLLDGVLTLEGTVLTDAQRLSLVVAGTDALGLANVIDRLEVSGLQAAIPGADERVAGLANALAGLNSAIAVDARLSARDLRFNATAPNQPQADSLLRLRGSASDLGLVISGDIIARKSVSVGDLDISASKQGERIVLDGGVFSTRQWRSLDNAARAVSNDVVNNIKITEIEGLKLAESDAQVAVLVTALADFDTASEARARLSSGQFSLDANVEIEEHADAMKQARVQASALGLNLLGKISSRQLSLEREIELLSNEIKSHQQLLLEHVVFESADNALGFAAKQALDHVVDAMIRFKRPRLRVIGHTDDFGSSDENRALSLQRAISVVDYIVRSGIAPDRLRAVGYGEAAPVASNSTEFGRQQNRRVEFLVVASF